MAEDLSIEEAEEAGLLLEDDVSWDEVDILRPGMDFKQGMTFVTMPAWLQVKKEVGAGKKAKTVVERQLGLAAVTSAGGRFAYTKEVVEKLGFGYPDNVIVPDERRWTGPSIEAFRSGDSEPPAPPALFNDIRKVYETYVEFAREEYYDVMTLFVMGSYMFRLFKSLGYIHFNGTAASGKSQNLNILRALAFNTSWASSMSSAALYRSLAGHPGTVCIDEAEGWEGERGEELRRILNSGYLDGSTVKRVEKGPGDRFMVAAFEAYGPKAIASINPLDAVIGSRCIVVGMRPALRKITEFDHSDPRWQALRDRLYLWLMFYAPQVSERIEEWNKETRFTRAPNLISRHWQITQMYTILADFIDSVDGGDRAERLIAFFTEYFQEAQRQQDATDRIRLVLRCLPRVLARYAPVDEGYFYLKTIHEVVSEYIEEDAKEYFKTRTVSKHLETLGFKKRRPHKQGQQVWLDPSVVRQEFKQRRVEPDPEDVAWLAGEVNYEPGYQQKGTATKTVDDLWSDIADTEGM
jgi:hypothetical protein